MLERCRKEEVSRDDCQTSSHSCDVEQLEASYVTETAHKKETMFKRYPPILITMEKVACMMLINPQGILMC